jgi:hypothetical protein
MNRLDNQAVDVQGLAAIIERTNVNYQELSYDGGNWAGIYDPSAKVMLGGCSCDGETFDDDFRITDVDEENALDSLRFCAGLYSEYGTIALSFNELREKYEKVCHRDAIIHSCEVCMLED